VELKVADTRSDKTEAAIAAFRLIEKEKVAAIIGEVASGNTIAGSFPAERRGIPMVAPTPTSPPATQGRRYVFGTCSTDWDQTRVAAETARRHFSASSAAIVYDMSQEDSVGLSAAFKDHFQRSGGTILLQAGFKMGDRDFTAQINRIRKAKPDVIYAPVHYTECALFIRQAREAGLDAPIIAGAAVQMPELIALGGKSVEGLIFTAHFREGIINTPFGEKFAAVFISETGRPVQAAQALGADTYLLIIDAIRRAGSCDPAGIREALCSTANLEGVAGNLTMKEDGSAYRPILVNQVKDGKFVRCGTGSQPAGIRSAGRGAAAVASP